MPQRTPSGKPLFLDKVKDGPVYAWTDLTYLLHKNQVSWRYYVVPGTEPDCQNPEHITCAPVRQNARTASIWNPLPFFDTVKDNRQTGNIQSWRPMAIDVICATSGSVSTAAMAKRDSSRR